MRSLPPIVLLVDDGSQPPVCRSPPPAIYIPQSEDAAQPFTVQGSNGSPYDISGWTIVVTVRRVYYDPDPAFIEKTLTGSGTSGTITFDAADTEEGVVDTYAGYRIDVFGTDGSGKRWQLRAPADFFITEAIGSPR